MKDLQEVGEEIITGNKCIHYRFQEFEIISRCWTGTKQTYSLSTARQIEIRSQRSNVNVISNNNLLKNINILYLTELRVCTESLIVENASLKICKSVFETLKVWKIEVKTQKMGKKKSLFLFSITELAVLEISYISIAHDQWSQSGGLYFIIGKAGFFIFRGHFKAVTVLEKVLNFAKLFTNPLKLLVLSVEEIMAWVNVKLQIQAYQYC